MGKISNLVRNQIRLYGDQNERQKEDRVIVIAEGDYGYGEGRHFVITRNTLGCPCAYIEVKSDDWAEQKAQEDEDCIDKESIFDGWVNGGYTYYGVAHWDRHGINNRKYVGWDYCHCDDWDPFSIHPSGHKWTFEEILMDVAQAYIGIEEQNEKHWEELHAIPTERDGT